MGRLFGTDGVRGIANLELTSSLAYKLGKAGAHVLSREGGNERPVVLVGKDTRISGDMLEAAITSGVLSMGGDIINVGVLPTPAIAHLVKRLEADAGVVISASHNPFEHNGLKFFNSQGYKLDDEMEEEIEDIISRDIDVSGHVINEHIGRNRHMKDEAFRIYVDFLKSTIDSSIEGMVLAVDSANGASYKVAEKVFTELGAKVHLIGNEPDGLNINKNCGSTHPERLCKLVKETGAEVGLAFDGDADRLIAVDEKGHVVDGDRLMYICAVMLKEKGLLLGDLITTTVMSNIGFHKALEKVGIKADITAVGDRYVLENMLRTGCILGGEQSGHIIFRNHTTTGDGVLSALQLLQAMKLDGRPLSEMAADVKLYPQILRNAKVKNENKRRFEKDVEILAAIKEVEEKIGGEGRVLIRPSGTEPLVRVMIEGKDQNEITIMAETIALIIEKNLG